MIKKFFSALIIIFLLCGCTAKNTKKDITFASWGSVSEVNIIKHLISDFEKVNPDIKVTLIHIPQNYFQKIQLLFASNTAPDVIFINNLYLPIYASKLEDLSNIADIEKYFPQTIKGMSYNDKLLGIPRDVSNQILYINTDLIGLPDNNWSLEELLSIAKSATTGNVFGLSYEDDIFWAMPYLCYYGGGILDKNEALIINSEQSKQGIEFYKNLVNKYKVAPSKSQIGSSTLAQMFVNGRIAMYFSGRWMYPKISETAKFNWSVMTFPIGKTPIPCDTSGWAVSKDSRYKESAIKFVQFLSSYESSKYFTETGLIVPARKDTALLLNNNTHNEKAFLDAIKQSETRVVNKDYKKLTDEINMKLNF